MLKIRMAKKEDVKKIAEIEARCFPVAEAAEEETLEKRYEAFSENFIVAEKDGEVIGFINGCTTDKPGHLNYYVKYGHFEYLKVLP